MFEGIVGFLKMNPGAVGIGVVIFILAAVAAWFLIRRSSKKDSQYSTVADTKDAKPENTVARVEEYKTAPPVVIPVVPLPTTEPLYACSCGATNLTRNLLGWHLLQMGKQEKGKHKSLGKITLGGITNIVAPITILPPVATGTSLIIDPKQTYRAVIWRYAGEGRESVIEFKQRINQPLGNIWYAEPSLPISGECYCVKELKNGNFEPYDPRQSNLKANETPTQAYLATHWGRAEGVWMYVVSNMQKISMLVIGGFLFITFIAILIKLGGK